MEMRRSPRCDVSNEEWWSLAALRVRSVVQRWRNRYAADRADASRACRGGKDSINETRCAVRLECGEVGIEIHPFRLTLLFIDVRNPHERRTSRLERGEDLGNE